MSDRARQTLEADAWMSVVHAYLACQRRYGQMLEHFDLTIAQFEFLAALRRHPDGVTPRIIAEELLVTKGNITGLIGRLEARGLVRRHPHASDGRSFLCELTDEGLALCRAAGAAAGRFVREQLASFTDADLERTRHQMLEMRAILDQLNPDAMAHPESAAGGKTHHA